MKIRNFSAEFKRDPAKLVFNKNYAGADATSAMDVGPASFKVVVV